jgi:hypothetical protein
MTEQEWMTGADPAPLLAWFGAGAGVRKRRLFAAACCRRIGDLLGRVGRKAVRVAEGHADGRLGDESLHRAHRLAVEEAEARRSWRGVRNLRRAAASWAAVCATRPAQPAEAARWAAQALALLAIEDDAPRYVQLWLDEVGLRIAWRRQGRGRRGKEREARWQRRVVRALEDAWWSERREQADLVRCLLGNPFRPLPAAPGAWNDGLLARMARAANLERSLPAGTLDPGRLGVLADALEDAGCVDDAVLAHCRGPGPHSRGCWVVDWLSGFEPPAPTAVGGEDLA